MDDNLGEWAGWNLWVWLECIGVVSGCCCKEVYIHSLVKAASLSSTGRSRA